MTQDIADRIIADRTAPRWVRGTRDGDGGCWVARHGMTVQDIADRIIADRRTVSIRWVRGARGGDGGCWVARYGDTERGGATIEEALRAAIHDEVGVSI